MDNLKERQLSCYRYIYAWSQRIDDLLTAGETSCIKAMIKMLIECGIHSSTKDLIQRFMVDHKGTAAKQLKSLLSKNIIRQEACGNCYSINPETYSCF
jgi:hypothetical protein